MEENRLNFILAIVKSFMAVIFMLLLLTLSPALLIGTGSCLALIGKLFGTLLKAAPLTYVSLSVIISLLWGFKVFLTSK